MQACDSCHERKVKCDKNFPCQRCSLAGSECHYTDRTKGRTYSQTHVDALERKIKRLETQNKVLVQQKRADTAPIGSQSAPVVSQHDLSASERIHTPSSGPADVAREVSYLSINASGERNYLGSSSGVLLANFIKANVAIETSTRPSTPPIDDQSTQSAGSIADIGRDLPSEAVARRLVVAYLNHDHLCYPVLHPATLLALLPAIYGTGSTFYAQHASEAFVFDIGLAIATASISRSDWQGLPSAHSHYERAMKRVSIVLEKGGLGGLQAIILLIQYRMSSSMQDTSASMWHLVGVGTRIALELGLHRESAYPQKPSRDDASDIEINSNLVQQEISRLCFWSIVCMDRIVSNILGRPLAIHIQDIDSMLPSDFCEEILLAGIELATAEHLTRNRISIFVQITKYRLLCGDIIEALHSGGRRNQSDDDLRLRREQFVADLNVWRLEAADVATSSGTRDNAEPSSCFTSPIWYDMIYHNAILMLHRPSPTLDISRDPVAVQAIFTSAQASISSYAALHRIGVLNHSWLTLQALFMAGLSYVYAVTMHCQVSHRQQGHRRSGLLQKNPSTMEIVNDTRKCSNILVAVSERWKSLQRCVDVFNRLSDAVLADVLKISATPRITATSADGEASTSNLNHSQLQRDDHSGPVLASHPNQVAQSIPWSGASFHQPFATDHMASDLSPLAIENEFRDSAFDLQQMYDQQQVDMSVYQFSLAWFDTFDYSAGMPNQLDDMNMDMHLPS
ncbi:fungal-specific transcription factor domain-containing protein [Paraphoma chrysanthemicola]|uniref:Fungal-specific transcription factor domain-containing protein n=1 Tax=Paraphoma chrysanthemicola TaxID=798071 RepID=A0A8K0QX90_9PLEO|nr:fungal-specific transcription factor domain-containing protein [Paraphoma chrysanthemicola]